MLQSMGTPLISALAARVRAVAGWLSALRVGSLVVPSRWTTARTGSSHPGRLSLDPTGLEVERVGA